MTPCAADFSVSHSSPAVPCFLGHQDIERMIPVWSPFLSVCLVSEKAIGKKEKVLGLQPSSSSLTQVVWWMKWGLEMLTIAWLRLVT